MSATPATKTKSARHFRSEVLRPSNHIWGHGKETHESRAPWGRVAGVCGGAGGAGRGGGGGGGTEKIADQRVLVCSPTVNVDASSRATASNCNMFITRNATAGTAAGVDLWRRTRRWQGWTPPATSEAVSLTSSAT